MAEEFVDQRRLLGSMGLGQTRGRAGCRGATRIGRTLHLVARQTQREDMLAAVLKGASLEAFALRLTDLPSASDEGAGLAMISESDQASAAVPPRNQ